MIDPAILRTGRFDHVIRVDMASGPDVAAVLESLIAELPHDRGIDVVQLSSHLAGRPLSDVAFVVREGARLAARAGKSVLDQVSLAQALEASRSSRPITGRPAKSGSCEHGTETRIRGPGVDSPDISQDLSEAENLRSVGSPGPEQVSEPPGPPVVRAPLGGWSTGAKWGVAIAAIVGVLTLIGQLFDDKQPGNAPPKFQGSSSTSSQPRTPAAYPVVGQDGSVGSRPPAGKSNALDLDQIRYCLAERVRMEAISPLVDSGSQPTVPIGLMFVLLISTAVALNSSTAPPRWSGQNRTSR